MNEEVNKVKYKLKKRKLKVIETQSSIFFKIIGILILMYSAYFSYSLLKDYVYNVLNLLSTASGKGGEIVYSNSWGFDYYYEVILSFIPVMASFAVSYYYYRHKNKLLSLYIANVTIFGFTLYQNYLFLYNLLGSDQIVIGHTNYYYSSFVLIIPLFLFFIFYKFYNNKFSLLLISICFFSILFQLQLSGFHPTYIFTSILLYNSIFYFIAKKENTFTAFSLNFLFSYFYLGLFVMRKLYLWHYTSLLSLFFIVSFLFFIYFLFIGLSIKSVKNKPFLPVIFSWINTTIYLILSIFVLNLFYDFGNFVPVLLAIISHSLIVIFSAKFNLGQSNLFYSQITIVFLAPVLFAVILPDYFFELFSGFTAVILLFYYRYFSNKIILWLSLIALQILMIHFIYLLFSFYFPVLGLFVTPSISILESGFINIAIVFFSTFGVKIYLSKISAFTTNKWVNKKGYFLYINLFLELIFFVLVAWFCYLIFVASKYNLDYFHSFLLLFSSIFAAYLFYNKSRLTSNKLIASCTLFVLVSLISILNFFGFPYYNINRVLMPNYLVIESIFHYLQLAIILFLLLKTSQIIIEIKKSKLLKRIFEMAIITLIILIICKEYDYLFLLRNVYDFTEPSLANFANSIEMNKLLPYSSILFFSAFVFFVVGVKWNNRFIRIFSLTIIVFDLIKVFYFEFDILTNQERIVILIILGLSFLFLSKIYSKEKVIRRRISSKK